MFAGGYGGFYIRYIHTLLPMFLGAREGQYPIYEHMLSMFAGALLGFIFDLYTLRIPALGVLAGSVSDLFTLCYLCV